MEYLYDNLRKKIAQKISEAPHVFFLFDYDGSLTPLMPKPELAKMKESTRKFLDNISKIPKFSVGIITGRKISEIRSIVQLDHIIYAGNHGLELEGPDFKYVHAKTKEFKRILHEVSAEIRPLAKNFPQTFLEDKEFTLTYHYRLLSNARVPDLIKEFSKIVAPWVADKKIKILEAKKAIEVRPNINWNKGSAVRWILLHEDPMSLPIYFGDDKTDEHAFKAVNDRGYSIRIGYEKESAAQYYLKSVYEVEEFLSFLAMSKSSKTEMR